MSIEDERQELPSTSFYINKQAALLLLLLLLVYKLKVNKDHQSSATTSPTIDRLHCFQHHQQACVFGILDA
jgi:hypothetical protein